MTDVITMKSKICLIGESSVGKTSLIRRFVLDLFDSHYISTIGTKVTKKELKLSLKNKDVKMDMTIWDIMGHRGFNAPYFYTSALTSENVESAFCELARSIAQMQLPNWFT